MGRRRKDSAAVTLGRRGGKARAAGQTPEERKASAVNAASARWAKTSPDEKAALLAKARAAKKKKRQRQS